MHNARITHRQLAQDVDPSSYPCERSGFHVNAQRIGGSRSFGPLFKPLLEFGRSIQITAVTCDTLGNFLVSPHCTDYFHLLLSGTTTKQIYKQESRSVGQTQLTTVLL